MRLFTVCVYIYWDAVPFPVSFRSFSYGSTDHTQLSVFRQSAEGLCMERRILRMTGLVRGAGRRGGVGRSTLAARLQGPTMVGWRPLVRLAVLFVREVGSFQGFSVVLSLRLARECRAGSAEPESVSERSSPWACVRTDTTASVGGTRE